MLFRSFVSATTFLTAVPFGGSIVLGTNDISYSRAFYPLVGLLIGLFLLILEKIVGLFLPELVNAGILLFSLLIITRGLHLDGFIDVCDGLFGGFTLLFRFNFYDILFSGTICLTYFNIKIWKISMYSTIPRR